MVPGRHHLHSHMRVRPLLLGPPVVFEAQARRRQEHAQENHGRWESFYYLLKKILFLINKIFLK